MQLKRYLALKGWPYSEMARALASAARAGEDIGRPNKATIERHANGKRVPSPIQQVVYARATEGAVRPQDWIELHTGALIGDEAAPAG